MRIVYYDTPSILYFNHLQNQRNFAPSNLTRGLAVPLFYVPSEGRHQGFQVMAIVSESKTL